MSSTCPHYIRRCALLAPCCNKYYPCRLCHDDVEDHNLDRKKVQEIKCIQCHSSQATASHCKECGIKFGRYFCGICRLFDDHQKGQFHCDGCGICRIGGKDNFFHCNRCDMCLGIQLKDSHKCVERSSRSDCPICYEDIHTSRIPAHVPPCGHLLHRYSLSNCQLSIITNCYNTDLSGGILCRDCHKLQILCRDCHKESRVRFHVVGLKCMECGSYNTSREGEEGVPVAAVPLPQAAHAPQDEEEWETEDEEEIVGGHEESESEEQDAVDDLVNLAQVELNLGDETDDNQVLPLD
ncbi:PREDICTED: RING finger and CHY zinc finger domain-containing protein 1-like [Acropora digitifera]|uniref:RING finger and CHY zinc finger domain-containing protein 1-like n=1 Tax=Acropora digitifera TaxID=70779 RepID=UPI00077ABE18|nr:PREDICTED: RING finger and CHY zinc finger domain-containing protein 1-like [Acropora digitifera]